MGYSFQNGSRPLQQIQGIIPMIIYITAQMISFAAMVEGMGGEWYGFVLRLVLSLVYFFEIREWAVYCMVV